MLDYVNEQKQRKSGQSDSLHTGFITTTSGRRREFRRTEKTDIGLCPIQGLPSCILLIETTFVCIYGYKGAFDKHYEIGDYLLEKPNGD